MALHTVAHPYILEDVMKDYYDRYKRPLAHMEVNALNEDAVTIFQQTANTIQRLRTTGYPVVNTMTWYGDEYQVGWQCGMDGDAAFDEHPVGLFYRGEPQPVAHLIRDVVNNGLTQLPIRSVA